MSYSKMLSLTKQGTHSNRFVTSCPHKCVWLLKFIKSSASYHNYQIILLWNKNWFKINVVLIFFFSGTTAFLKASILNITMPQPTTTSSLPQTATTISTTPAVTTTTNTISTTPTFTTTTTTTTTTPAPTCPSDYKWDPNIPFCHKITTDPKESWPNARAACQTVGADLAIIDVSAKFSKILSDRKYRSIKLLGVIEIIGFFN